MLKVLAILSAKTVQRSTFKQEDFQITISKYYIEN